MIGEKALRKDPIVCGDEFHFLEVLPPTNKKERPFKPCRVCTKNKKRKETRYFCGVCPEKPALCIDKCFKEYHIQHGHVLSRYVM